MQVTDKRIHQVKLELSVNETSTLRKAIDHYLALCSRMNHNERANVDGRIDLETLAAMSSHLKLIQV